MSINIGETLTKPVDIIQRNPGIIVPAVIPAVVALIFGLLFMGMYGGMLLMGNPAMLTGSFAILGVYLIILAILGLIANGAIVSMAYAEITGEEMDYNTGIRIALDKLGPLLIASIIIGVGITIGTFLLVIPGLVFALLVMFSIQEIMIGGRDGIEAIKESINLVKANFGTCLVYAIILMIVVAVVSTLLGLIPVIGNVISTLIITPYLGISLTMAYLQLKPAEI